MSARFTIDSVARTLARKSSRRGALKGGAAVAAAGTMLKLGIQTPGASAQDAAEIAMWFDTTGGAETANCLVENVVDVYNAQGGTQVKATLQPNGWDAVRTALAGGAGPDVVGTPGPSYIVELVNAGNVASLDDAATKYGWSDSILGWALDLGKTNGVLYSIPDEIETLILYYNTTVFDDNGWTAPKTMDELITLCQTISDAGIIPFAHGNSEWRPSNEWFVGEFMNQVAGPQKVYEALTGAAKFTDPEFVDAISKLNDMQQKGWFMGGLDRYYTSGSADTASAFAYGDAAMKIEGTWFLSDAMQYTQEAGTDWNWVPVPSKDGTAIFDLGIGSTYSINAKSKAIDATADFLNYFFSVDAQAAMVAKCGMAPAPVTIPTEKLGDIDPRQAAMIDALNTASAGGSYGYTTWTFFPPKTEQYLIENVEKVWAGDMTVEDYLAGIQGEFDAELAAGAVLPIPARS
jgi:raffinose/stachyose/melibiose transport system substrate-binding protein